MKRLKVRFRARIVWWASLIPIGGAAAGMTGWSLYTVAHGEYGVPHLLAIGTAAVFDGTAMACLFLAGQAIRERRSALGPHCATLGLAAVSIYLNRLHANLIHGGTGAFLLFATPTVALLLLAGLSWSATRSRLRAEDGEKPATLPRLGVWGWLLAREEAWARTKKHVVEHVVSPTGPPAEPEPRPQPTRTYTATERLRERFSAMDPAKAIEIVHESQPGLTPSELASLLIRYGVIVDAVQVALVLHEDRPHITVQRGDAPTDAGAAPHDAPQVGALPPVSKTRAILDAASCLGPDARAADIAKRAQSLSRLPVDPAYVRTVLSREARRARQAGQEQLVIDGVGKGGGGYA
ncbi:DUF2637 domain-containing protein [Streptomyces sp. NPDC053048]|uniref:DUF2637 domain-containing protein n=1 Tax=Streptomyces sp. NPDC053048 TaxID=3365694 RepID=UPI0037D28830